MGSEMCIRDRDFPPGFTSPFTVEANGQNLGSYSPGQIVDFTQFSTGGVSNFRVTGINPLVDPANPTVFPLKLAFNTPTANFTMQGLTPAITAVPEPGTLALLAMAAGPVAGVAVRRRRRA